MCLSSCAVLGLAFELNSSIESLNLCPGSSLAATSSSWVWSHGSFESPSCTKPASKNAGHMCSGDPTSIVMHTHGDTSCLGTHMPDCRFNMHHLQQLDFDLRMVNCGGTWAAPLWLTPDYWEGGGSSGEIDMVENCPVEAISSNFAGAEPPLGYQKQWKIADPNGFSGHVTMWNSNGDITVKLCSNAEKKGNGGHCTGNGAAFYPNVYKANGCSDGHNCMFEFVSDIWNGVEGDDGFVGCRGKSKPSTRNCGFSVRKIRLKGPSFTGKCAALGQRRRSATRRRSGSRRRSWKPCKSGICCDPHSKVPQRCPGGESCRPCGAAACQCPSQFEGQSAADILI